MTTRAWIWVALTLGACEHHPHGEAAHGEAAHAEEAHGHGEGATALTHFSEATELFVEIPPLVVGEGAEIAAHFTTLADFRPVTAGRLEVQVGAESFVADAPARSGIFTPTLEPTVAGEHPLVFRVTIEGREIVHDLGRITVFADDTAAQAHQAPEGPEGIAFLKEQQWVMDFATVPAAVRPLRSAFAAFGTLRARADGEAYVSAPVAGRLVESVPRLGTEVKPGEPLLALVPRLAEVGDGAALDSAVAQARIAVRQATQERKRLEGLLAAGAVPERRVQEARFAEAQARASLATAGRRQAQGDLNAAPEGSVQRLVAPLAGTVVAVEAVPGAFVEEGARLLRIVDLDRLWLEVQVAETHAKYLENPRGVRFTVEGFEQTFEASEVVAAGGVLDPQSRTIPLLVAVDNADRRLRVGMFADAQVVTGDPREGLAVPLTAIVHESGLPVVYVLVGGETFERRPVRVGVRDGDHIEVVDGLKAGERVVSRGAWAVRLAASASALPAHGHAH